MIVNEDGATEETVTTEEMTVTVDGTDYTTELSVDLNEDGQSDASVVDNPDGTKSVYVDTDGDRHADQYAEVNAQGDVVAEARYDEASGEWIAVDPSAPVGSEPTDGGDAPGEQPPPDETDTAGGGVIVADLPDGEVEVGPPTLDTNNDGVDDTAVAEDADGTTYYFTDIDADGEADFAVVVTANGETHALEHQGDGQWTEVELPEGAPGSEAAAGVAAGFADTAAGTDRAEGVAKIDALSGQWMSAN